MCGIAGFYSNTPQPARLIREMTTIIRHRGPDDEGYLLKKEETSFPLPLGGQDTPETAYSSLLPYAPSHHIESASHTYVKLALGHRRLAIIDLSPYGHQPMCSPDMNCWIVYNGEIYNYSELRSELERLGHHFFSKTDTEVILAAYIEWGEECLNRFNGMWALAIYDSRQNKLFLARDRFGEKPLYYWISPDGLFAFASEIKQFTALPGWNAQIKGQRVYDFLAHGLSDHTFETMFKGVFQLPPGHKLLVSCSSQVLQHQKPLLTVPWYKLTPNVFYGTFEDACEEFRRRFIDSVALRLRSDAPIGSCLSGGLDSSSIVCVINQLLRQKNNYASQKTFSACSKEHRFDEGKWIDTVVAEIDVEAYRVYPSLENLFDESSNITWHQDEPYGSTSIYAQWNVFRLAAINNVKVMLDGQGADEQLAGYHGYFGPQLATLFRSMRWLELLRSMQAMHQLHDYSHIVSIMHLINNLLPAGATQLIMRARRPIDWLSLEKLDAEYTDPLIEYNSKRKTISSLSHSQLTASNLQMLLHWEDRNSMAHSIETRVPFLDHQLVEFTLGLPDEYKISRGMTKRILRGAMSGILPPPVRNRIDKISFATPEEIWIRDHSPELFLKKIKDAIDMANGIFHPSKSLDLVNKIIIGKHKFSYLPWRIISLGEWIQTYSVKV